MNAFDQDSELIKKYEERKKQQKKDERKVAKVEQLVDAKEIIESKQDDVEGSVDNKSSYYLGILERAEASYEKDCEILQKSYQTKIDSLRKEINILEDKLENGLAKLRKERDGKLFYAQQQIDKQQDALTKRQASFEKRIERKERKIQKVANSITTVQAKQEVAELVSEPTSQTTQIKEAQTFLQNGGHYFEVKEKFPLAWATWKETETKEKLKLAQSPEGRLRRQTAETELNQATLAAKEREDALGALNKKVRDAEAVLSAAKVRIGCTQDEKDTLRTALEAAIIDRDTYRQTFKKY